MSPIRVCIAGATGWAGSALARGVHASDDLELIAGVSRSAAGSTLADAGLLGCDAPIFGTVEEALAKSPQVLVEYTKPDAAKHHALAALRADAHVVVGTSGLTEEDYEELDAVARARDRGVLAAGNFALTAVLAQRFAELAARYVPHWEIFDYAGAGKADVPSGTVRELAHRLAASGGSRIGVPWNEIAGPVEARGATLGGSQVHSVRLPGYVLSFETVFGLPDQRLTIRHDAGSSAQPYVDGGLLAIREVGRLVGVHRGLDKVMEL